MIWIPIVIASLLFLRVLTLERRSYLLETKISRLHRVNHTLREQIRFWEQKRFWGPGVSLPGDEI